MPRPTDSTGLRIRHESPTLAKPTRQPIVRTPTALRAGRGCSSAVRSSPSSATRSPTVPSGTVGVLGEGSCGYRTGFHGARQAFRLPDGTRRFGGAGGRSGSDWRALGTPHLVRHLFSRTYRRFPWGRNVCQQRSHRTFCFEQMSGHKSCRSTVLSTARSAASMSIRRRERQTAGPRRRWFLQV